jgi:endonuclease/exonuclease/phosphatase family metal-dependent hydrolase
MLPAPELVAANFNLHAGIDGWGRRFDVVASCAALEPDVLVLEETWTPDNGISTAQAVGRALGLSVHEHGLARARRMAPHPEADHRWMRPMAFRPGTQSLVLDGERGAERRAARNPGYETAERGTWGIAVLSRFPVLERQTIELEPLRRDPSQRAAILVRLDVAGHTVTVVGTHMSHLSHGSLLHFRRLHRLLDDAVGVGPAILAGDMNLWGPPVAALFPGWRRTVRARTWPAWNPHSQVDHVLVRGDIRVLGGEALPATGSDHRPVRVRLSLA